MRRIDKVLSDARALRVARALRAQGKGGRASTRGDEWIEELLAGQALAGEADPADRESGASSGPPVFDIAALAPFMRRVAAAIDAVFDEMRPDLAIGAAVADRAIAELGLVGDVARTRRAAAIDLAMLAAEASLLAVVQSVVEGHDRARKTRLRAGRRDVIVESGRIRRVRRAVETAVPLGAAGRLGQELLQPQLLQPPPSDAPA